MAKIELFTSALIVFLMVPVLNLGAQERDDQVRKMEELYAHARELEENGEVEESRRVMGAVNRMRRAQGEDSGDERFRSRRQVNSRNEIDDLQREREELRLILRRGVSEREANEIREELERIERVIEEKADAHRESREHAGDRRRHDEFEGRRDEAAQHHRDSDGDEWEHRMHHLVAAAEHLHEAGLHDLGEQVENQIGELENERHQSHGRESAELESLLHEMMERMEDFHRQMDELREEVRRLKR